MTWRTESVWPHPCVKAFSGAAGSQATGRRRPASQGSQHHQRHANRDASDGGKGPVTKFRVQSSVILSSTPRPARNSTKPASRPRSSVNARIRALSHRFGRASPEPMENVFANTSNERSRSPGSRTAHRTAGRESPIGDRTAHAVRAPAARSTSRRRHEKQSRELKQVGRRKEEHEPECRQASLRPRSFDDLREDSR